MVLNASLGMGFPHELDQDRLDQDRWVQDRLDQDRLGSSFWF